MKWIETRKIISLSLTAVFVIIAIGGFFMGKVQFAEIVPIITMVIGYYFGKSTALDKPY